jgi:hypothetical protein
MRSKTYGDKQREAQQRKKQQELWRKKHPEAAPTTDTPAADADQTETSNDAKKQGQDRRSA